MAETRDTLSDRLTAGVEVPMQSVPASLIVVSGGRMVPFLPLESVVDAEAERDRLRAENEALAALINGWACNLINGADRGKLAAAMLDQEAVGRYIAQVNAEDDEVERLREGLEGIKRTAGRAWELNCNSEVYGDIVTLVDVALAADEQEVPE